MNRGHQITRRALLRNVAALAGAAAFPYIVPSSATGNAGGTSASNRVTLGCIGVGGRGTGVMQALLATEQAQVVAICDVDANRRESVKSLLANKYDSAGCAAYSDFREITARDDIDAVMIATPDHWHALLAIAAAKTGKAVYCEKPLALTIDQGRKMVEAVQRYGTVFQAGTQHRSEPHFRRACELVRNGRIGKLQRIIAATPASRAVDSYRPSPVPSDLDYDMWVGPARWMPYTQGVMGSCGNWGHVSNFSLGWVTTWGIHHVDIAQWGNNADTSGPVEVEGTGVFPKDGLYDCAVAWDMTLKYANGVTLNFVDNKKRKQGVLFEGSDGWVFVERGSIDAQPKSLLNEKIGSDGIHLPVSNDHSQNFLDCVRTRTTPVSSIEAAVRSDTVCHLSDIAMRLGRKLNWNPAAERFIDDEQANRMLTRSMRAPWHI